MFKAKRCLQLSNSLGEGRKKQGNREILNKSIILIVVMTSGMFVYVQTNQTVHTKYIQLIIVYQLLVDKTF